MRAIYQLEGPLAPAKAPRWWSFSNLATWRVCPLHWWLSGAAYPRLDGKYPRVPTVRAIEGSAVHVALEVFMRRFREDERRRNFQDFRRAFSLRYEMNVAIAEVVKRECDGNPRADAKNVMAAISVDDCIDQFKDMLNRMEAKLTSGGRRQKPEHALALPTEGHGPQGVEVTLKADDPAIWGRLDLLGDTSITDFKTGEAKAAHAEQVRFYALLVYLAQDRVLSDLTLIYAGGKAAVAVEAPTREECREMAEQYRQEIRAIELAIKDAQIVARPSVDACGFCEVRQGCPAYWSAPETGRLRLSRDVNAFEQDEPSFAWQDVSLVELPKLRDGVGCFGAAKAQCGMAITLGIEGARCPPMGEQPIGARLLRARVQRREGRIAVSAGPATEVFWYWRPEDAAWTAVRPGVGGG